MSLPTNLIRYAGIATVAVTAGALTQLAPASAASFAPASSSIQHRVLKVVGTPEDDTITLTVDEDGDVVRVDLGDDSEVKTFDRDAFDTISVGLGGGDDDFETSSDFGDRPDPKMSATGGPGDDVVLTGTGNDLISGGSGDDTLLGSAGADRITADSGNDAVDGGAGADTETLGSGNDRAFWLPGEASDVVHGGIGHDVLNFDGADMNEQMRLSGTVAHAVFAREPGGIRMTLDSVEAVEAQARGGDDTVTLNGTNKAEGVDVRVRNTWRLENEVAVTGLPLSFVLVDPEPTDVLVINALGGRDRVTVHRGVRDLIETSVRLGTGNPA